MVHRKDIGVHAPLAALMVVYALLFSFLSLRLHQTFHTGNDLAVFSQVIWNTTQGRPFETSLVAEATNFLGQHFSPILALFTPLYAIRPDAGILLVSQAVIVALGAIPLYAYATRKLGGTRWGLGIATAYLLFPAVHFVTLDEFHPIALAIPLLGFAAYSLLMRRYRAFFLVFAVAMLVKEETTLILAGMGLLIFFVHRRIRLGIVTTALGVGLAGLLLYVIIPGLARPGYGYVFTHRYDYLGENVTDIVFHLVTHPQMVLPYLLIWPKALFLIQLFGAVSLLPLLAPGTLLMALPTFVYLLLSDYPFQYSIQHQYTAPLIPILFLAAVDGLYRLYRWGQGHGHDWRVPGMGMLLGSALLAFALWSPAPLGGAFDPSEYAITAHVKAGHRLLAQIPAQASVASDWKFYPHLSNRRVLGDLLNPRVSPVDFVLVDQPPGYVSAPLYPHVLLPKADQPLVYPLFQDIVKEDNITLSQYQRDIVLQGIDARFGEVLRLVAMGWINGPYVPAGQPARLVLVWQATSHLDKRYVFFVHLLRTQDQETSLVAQDDQELGRGLFPTTKWDEWGANKLLADEYTLSPPPTLPAGDYTLTAGVYPRSGGPNLTGTDRQGNAVGNEVYLGVLHLTQSSPAREGGTP
ncbi:MAG: DUF2079 domain-containing protein [Chloroflexi bacterium]|nr:DUF2079 domain-containing protein [Chloroflexota bacterium]